MKKVLKYLLAAIILALCVAVFLCLNYFLKNKNIQKENISQSAITAAVVQAPIETVAQKKFNILIVPGHDVKDGGANYKNIYERNLVAIIGAKISDILNREGNYNVTTTRDENNWNQIFSEYFQNQKQEIIDWKNKCQMEDKALMASGQKKYVPDMGIHSNVTPDVSVKLYGINKWANENNIDMVLNLHFNDEQRPHMNTPGDLKGFAIFIPESQMKNSATSRLIAQNIYDQLKNIEPPEINNLLEDQSLIALGASGTLNAPSILVEYGYIYEKKFADENTLDRLAEKTALGIENYIKTINNK